MNRPQLLGLAGVAVMLLGTAPARAETVRAELRGAVVVPRGQLGAGGLVGIVASRPLGSPRMRVQLGFDWTHLTSEGAQLVGPPAYPRGNADVIQRTNLYTIAAGASYDLVRRRTMRWYGGGAVGVAINRTDVDAYSMTQPTGATAPLVQLETGVSGQQGRLTWTAALGWRETSHDLGAGGSASEETSSGLLLGLGVGAVF